MNPFQMCGRKIVKTHAREKRPAGCFCGPSRNPGLLHWEYHTSVLRDIILIFSFIHETFGMATQDPESIWRFVDFFVER